MSGALVRSRRLWFLVVAIALAISTAASALPGVVAAQENDRVIETAYGDVHVPASPERVVVLNEQALDTALAVGVKPAGTVSSRGATGVAAYLQEQAEGIAIVGTARETNLESVVELQPDLILADPSTDQETFELLNGIAPTVVPTFELGSPWQDLSRYYASALGKEAEIERVLADLDQRIQELRTKLGENEGASVVVLRWMPNGPMVMSAQTITGQLLEALGFELPPIAKELEGVGHSDVLSLENLTEIDVDWIFIATLNEEAEDALQTAMAEPAFQQLPAAQAGHVMAVNGQLWSSASGPLAAQAILDDIETAMVGNES